MSRGKKVVADGTSAFARFTGCSFTWRFVLGQLEGTYLQVLIVSPISCRGEVQNLQSFSLQWNCEGREKISQDGVFRLSHPSFVTNHYAAAEII